jgi:hypothetical protein
MDFESDWLKAASLETASVCENKDVCGERKYNASTHACCTDKLTVVEKGKESLCPIIISEPKPLVPPS